MDSNYPTVSVIIPTSNRNELLRMVLPHYLSQPYVQEVILLDDASTRPITESLGADLVDDPRIRVIRFDEARHQPMLRNVGVQQSRGEWIFMGEDDAFPEPNHFAILIAEALQRRWLVVAGRLIDVWEGETPEIALTLSNRQNAGIISMLMYEAYFDKPANEAMEFPFLHAKAMIHRDAFRTARYDPGFANCVSYREETDFYLTLHTLGVRLGFTPKTIIYHLRGGRKKMGGIYQSSWLKKEWLVWRNELRFEKKHREFFMKRFSVLGHPLVRFPLFVVRRYVVGLARRLSWGLLRRCHET